MVAAPPMPRNGLRKWQRPAKTTVDLDWADLKVLDISSFDDGPEARRKLAGELRDAVHNTGFFSVIGTGFTANDIQEQYDIGQTYFDLPLKEKGQDEYRCQFEAGNYFGYRAAYEKTLMSTDVLDNIESFNVAKFNSHQANEARHPFFEPHRQAIESFSRRALAVASKIFVLFAIVLELPDDYFSSKHEYEDSSEDHLRYMIYHPRSAEDDAKVQNTWSRAHTDFGSLTLLWSQDVAGLQIKTSEGKWRYVPPVDDGIICNVGDTLDFWSAGYMKSTTHRVVRPPPDQVGQDRIGLFYFVRPGNDVDIKPAPSPLLERLGRIKSDQANAAPVRGLEYVRARVKNYHDHSNYADMKGKSFKVGDLSIEDEAA